MAKVSWIVMALLLTVVTLGADDPPSLDKLLTDLGSADPVTREAATSALVERGGAARGAVVKRWLESKDPEVRARTLAVLQSIDGNEFLRLMTAADGPAPARAEGGAASSPASDVAGLLDQVNADDWRAASNALLRLNEVAHGVIFSVSMREGSEELPEPFARLFVLLARDRIGREMDGWSRVMGGGSAALPPTLRPIGHEDIEALIDRDPGRATEDKMKRPKSKTRADGGVFSYRYPDRPPFYPTGRVAPNGVVHQFTYDETGQLAEWRVCPGNDQRWVAVRFFRGEPVTLADSDCYAVTFK